MTFLKQFAFITTLLIGIFATYLSMATTINEDGLHVQPWFTDSFLFLKEDDGVGPIPSGTGVNPNIIMRRCSTE